MFKSFERPVLVAINLLGLAVENTRKLPGENLPEPAALALLAAQSPEARSRAEKTAAWILMRVLKPGEVRG